MKSKKKKMYYLKAILSIKWHLMLAAFSITMLFLILIEKEFKHPILNLAIEALFNFKYFLIVLVLVLVLVFVRSKIRLTIDFKATEKLKNT